LSKAYPIHRNHADLYQINLSELVFALKLFVFVIPWADGLQVEGTKFRELLGSLSFQVW